MSELMEEKQKLLEKLKEVKERLTDDVIKNATNEELEEYIGLIDEITVRLQVLNEYLEEN